MRYDDHQHCEFSHECRMRTHVCAITCRMEKAGVGLALCQVGVRRRRLQEKWPVKAKSSRELT